MGTARRGVVGCSGVGSGDVGSWGVGCWSVGGGGSTRPPVWATVTRAAPPSACGRGCGSSRGVGSGAGAAVGRLSGEAPRGRRTGLSIGAARPSLGAGGAASLVAGRTGLSGVGRGDPPVSATLSAPAVGRGAVSGAGADATAGA